MGNCSIFAGKPNASQPIGCNTVSPLNGKTANYIANGIVTHMTHVQFATG